MCRKFLVVLYIFDQIFLVRNKIMSKKILTILLAILALTSNIEAQNTITVPERDKVLAIDGRVLRKNPPETIQVEGIGSFKKRITQNGTNSMRIHFRTTGTFQPNSIALRVLNASENVVWTFSCANSSQPQFWSYEVPGNQAIVEVLSTYRDNRMQVIIDAITITEPPRVPVSITPPKNQMIDIAKEPDPERKNWAKSVAKLKFIADDKTYNCTGFLISANLLITNKHCLQNDVEWRSTQVLFDYATGESTKSSCFTELVTPCDEPDCKNLDYAIFRLELTPPGRVPLQLDSETQLNIGRDLLIIQHPGGELKQISVLDCKVVPTPPGVQILPNDFVHLCDTKGGSSGSGVIDKKSKKVIGLHHLGWDEDQDLPEDQRVNYAVKMRDIIEHIKRKYPSIAAEIGLQ